MSNLFGSSNAPSKDVLVQFKAGKMNFDEKTSMVTAEKRKGIIQVKKMDDLIHFIWKERKAGSENEIDLIIFADDAVFRKVEEAKARVYLLDFKTSSGKFFFWMQEASEDKDEDIVKRVNNAFNGNAEEFGSEDSQKKALLDLLGKKELSETSSEKKTTSSEDILKSILSRYKSDNIAPILGDIVNTQEILSTGVLDDEAVVKELQSHLPENEHESAVETLRSPQFRQAVQALNEAIQRGQLDELLTSFGLDMPSGSGGSSKMESFLKAVQENVNKSKDKQNE